MIWHSHHIYAICTFTFTNKKKLRLSFNIAHMLGWGVDGWQYWCQACWITIEWFWGTLSPSVRPFPRSPQVCSDFLVPQMLKLVMSLCQDLGKFDFLQNLASLCINQKTQRWLSANWRVGWVTSVLRPSCWLGDGGSLRCGCSHVWLPCWASGFCFSLAVWP